MNFIKKTIRLLVSAAALTAFTACSSPAKEQEPSKTPEQAAETTQPVQSEAPVQTPEPTPTPVPVAVPDPKVPGPFTDPEAFAGFDTYTAGGHTVTLGSTKYGEINQYIHVKKASQFSDETHEYIADAEVLQAGAMGRVLTDYYAKTGGQLSYMLYNPVDDDAEFADCVIVGVQDEEGMTFSNGINYWTVTPDQLKEILGEPHEIRGKVTDTSISAQFIWRDETDVHELVLIYYDDGKVKDVNGLSYFNVSARP